MTRRYARGGLVLWVRAGVLGGCAGTISGLSIPTTGPSGAAAQIPATVLRPDGPGPSPAIVIMHDCSGLASGSSGAPDRWAREPVRRGYVILMPDSFTTRGHPGGVCTNPSPSRVDVSPVRRVRDAYAALAYLRTLPGVDGRRVGLMGGSHGGTTTLVSMAAPESDTEPLARERRAGFAAAVALYPACALRPGRGRAGSEVVSEFEERPGGAWRSRGAPSVGGLGGPVGVGTAVTRRPLRRSGRAALPHPALVLGADAEHAKRRGVGAAHGHRRCEEYWSVTGHARSSSTPDGRVVRQP